MDRFRSLDRYPKIILIALLVMAVVFAGVYGVTASRVGFAYQDAILVPRQEGGATVYEGKLEGRDCVFTVTGDTVTLVCGKTYGPYTLREDPTALPDDHALSMTGIEILDGGKVFFRGGITGGQEDFWLIDEDGSSPFMTTYTMVGDGIEYDMDGNPIDPVEPAPYDIVSLLRGPELTHKGQWQVYWMMLFTSALVALSVLFADELFYLSLAFRVRGAEYAEPSDWEITSRIISWTILTGAIAIGYLMGLGIS